MSHRRGIALLTGVLLCLTGTELRAEQQRGPELALRGLMGDFAWEEPVGTPTDLAGGVVVNAAPDTAFERLPDMKIRTGAQATTHTYVYRLTKGQLHVSVSPHRGKPTAVLVFVPGGLSGAISQGSGTVRVDSEAISFTAETHPMLVGKGEHSRLLGAGRTLAIEAGGGYHEVHLPDPPDLFLEHGLALSLPKVGFEATVRMKPDPNLVRFEVALLKRNADGGWTSIATKRTQGTEALFQGNGSGDYAVVGRAFDRFGVESRTSAPLHFRTIGVKLPEGAQVVSGGFALTPRQHLELSEVEGLVMTFGFGESFIEAPRALSLQRGRGALVRLLDPNTRGEVRFQLVPHVVRAQIQIGSPRTTWPKDRTAAVVKLVDGNGRPIKSSAGYTAQVSVNSEPYAVHWQRSGNVMRAVVTPPRFMLGPWVVRIEVKNRQGELVGREFLEIAPSPKPEDAG